MSEHDLPDRYDPQSVEANVYKWWEKNSYFKAEDLSTKPPFSIILPPPNVTGSLHIGHALDHTIQDVLIRWKRMSGFNTVWVPGTDHAGIATQMVVEKELKKEGLKRQDLGREKFVEKVWDWKKTYGNRIVEQMKRLGNSCDWDRLTFTLDDGVSDAVRKVFVSLYEKGLIYKGTRLINWSCPLETAISDLEVEHKETKGHLWHFDYPLADSDQVVTIATTRPETMLGDTALCVHPEDERYKSLIGKKVKLPLTNREIEIIADEYVDKEFGSGVVKITPAHDFNDYEIGKRHKLEFINILNKDGTLNEHAGEFKGLKVQEARKQVVAAMEEQGLLNKIEDHKNSVGYCSRSGAVVEPYLSSQWFVKIKPLAKEAQHVVESGTTSFEPESWTKTYLHWMNIIEDWCISRQLWWGHRIPAWNCSDCSHVTVTEDKEVTKCEGCGSGKVSQDEDVLDTWFSSQLWPFSTLGWPNETEALKTFYPTDVLVTGHDIIFFWVSRMIMSGLEFCKDVPFRTVYIHGLVRDSQGKKMSKSVGNTVDPVELIDQYGADALRFTLISQLATGKDLKFSQQRLEGYRNFMNKIWNATRFSLAALKDFDTQAEAPQPDELSAYDQWLIYKLQKVTESVDKHLTSYRFSDAANDLYTFVWNDLCDWYLEFIKLTIYGEESSEKKATQHVLANVLNYTMRLLHPFIPFLTEEIYQKLPVRTEALVVSDFPHVAKDKEFFNLGAQAKAEELDFVKEVITAFRNIRGENQIKASEKFAAIVFPKDTESQRVMNLNRASVERLAGLKECEIKEVKSLSKCAVTPVHVGKYIADVIVPLEGLIDIDEEVKRIEKNKEKILKDIFLLEKKLGNERFVQNAPEEVVLADKELLLSHKSRFEVLEKSLQRLKD